MANLKYHEANLKEVIFTLGSKNSKSIAVCKLKFVLKTDHNILSRNICRKSWLMSVSKTDLIIYLAINLLKYRVVESNVPNLMSLLRSDTLVILGKIDYCILRY